MGALPYKDRRTVCNSSVVNISQFARAVFSKMIFNFEKIKTRN